MLMFTNHWLHCHRKSATATSAADWGESNLKAKSVWRPVSHVKPDTSHIALTEYFRMTFYCRMKLIHTNFFCNLLKRVRWANSRTPKTCLLCARAQMWTGLWEAFRRSMDTKLKKRQSQPLASALCFIQPNIIPSQLISMKNNCWDMGWRRVSRSRKEKYDK